MKHYLPSCFRDLRVVPFRNFYRLGAAFVSLEELVAAAEPISRRQKISFATEDRRPVNRVHSQEAFSFPGNHKSLFSQ